jgi:hypothetical protein
LGEPDQPGLILAGPTLPYPYFDLAAAEQLLDQNNPLI